MPVSLPKPLPSSPVPGLADALDALRRAVRAIDKIVDHFNAGDQHDEFLDAMAVGYGLRLYAEALGRLAAPPVLQAFGQGNE